MKNIIRHAPPVGQCPPSLFAAADGLDKGVSKDEIVLGALQDLSGPLAGYGKDLRNGMQMRVAEANNKGGVHGRKIRLLVEDSGYDPRRRCWRRGLVEARTEIFVMAGSHGHRRQNNAALPVQTART